MEDAEILDKPFDESKIFNVIKNFQGDKALGLDGFP